MSDQINQPDEHLHQMARGGNPQVVPSAAAELERRRRSYEEQREQDRQAFERGRDETKLAHDRLDGGRCGPERRTASAIRGGAVTRTAKSGPRGGRVAGGGSKGGGPNTGRGHEGSSSRAGPGRPVVGRRGDAAALAAFLSL